MNLFLYVLFFLSDIVRSLWFFYPVPLFPLEFRAHSLADRKTQQLHVASHVLVRPFSRDSLVDGRFQSKLLPFPPLPPPQSSHRRRQVFAARVNDSERQRATLLFVVGEVGVFTLIFAALLCRTL